ANNGPYKSSTPINAIGASNGFQQVQVQNRGYGNYSSSDLVAANDGTRGGTVPVNTDGFYVDLGINSSAYSSANSNILNQPYTSYLYASSPQNFFIGNGYSGKDLVFFTNYGSTNANNTADGVELMRLTGGTSLASQQVTIGTPAPNGTNKLTVNGSVSALAYNISSDRRLKTNIKTLKYGLKQVLAFEPVTYNWKKNIDTNTQLGLIAPDLKKIIPDVVSGNEETGKLSINYTELVPVLINAIKEQQKQIEDLKKRVQKLEKK
ncbi:MAG: tail fiber domain-containing protein, partial [Segetibacter sp.]